MSLVSTAAVVLKTHAYGDSSLVVKCLTDDFGVQTLMARGVRARSGKGGAAPEPFATGVVTFYHRAGREMHTLRSFEPESLRRRLTSSMVRFSGAALLAELVLRHSGAEGHTGLQQQLGAALDDLATCPEEDAAGVVVTQCWKLVAALGYRPEVLHCVHCARDFGEDEIGRFDFSLGGVRCSACATNAEGPRIGPGARRELSALTDDAAGPVVTVRTHLRPHLQLLSDFVTYHVSGSYPLAAFGYFASFLPAVDG